MDNAPAEGLDLDQGGRQVVNFEVRQREGVSRAAPASMDSDRWVARARLPAVALPGSAGLQRKTKQAGPEATCTLSVIRRKLDQRQWRSCHGDTVPAATTTSASAGFIRDSFLELRLQAGSHRRACHLSSCRQLLLSIASSPICPSVQRANRAAIAAGGLAELSVYAPLAGHGWLGWVTVSVLMIVRGTMRSLVSVTITVVG